MNKNGMIIGIMLFIVIIVIIGVIIYLKRKPK